MEVVRRVVAVHIDDARPFLERCLGIDTARVGAGLAVDFGAFVVFIYELRFVARHGLRSFRISDIVPFPASCWFHHTLF